MEVNKQIFICPSCGGAGKIKDSSGVPEDKYTIPTYSKCGRCAGTGRVVVTQTEEPYKEK